MTARVLIIPAAGSGSRLGSTRPKFLTPVGGRSMISYLIELYRDTVDLFAVIVHPTALAEAESELASVKGPIRFFEQRRRTGMLDAILIPRSALEIRRPIGVWVTWCDQIAIHPRTIERLSQRKHDDVDGAPDLLFPTMEQKPPYIHLVRNSDGHIVDVLHARESDEMPPVGETDMGLFRLSDRAYFELLPEYSMKAEPGEGTGERNFLPFVPWLARRGRVATFPGHNPVEALGINTPEDLQRIERYLLDGE